MNQGLKVFLSCALGAGIGSQIALDIRPSLFWLGFLIGGFCGYISYEFKKVLKAFSTAWKSVIHWKSDREWWEAYTKMLSGGFVAGLSFGVIIAQIILLVAQIIPPSVEEAKLYETKIFWVALTFCVGVAGIIVTALSEVGLPTQDMKEFGRELWTLNPVTLYGWYLPKGMLWLILRIPKGFLIFCRMLKTIFELIHSEMRLLCGVDAAIGAAVGYYFGSATIGAVVGGLFGLLNFEVVSKRWLKLIPTSK